jgi:hypothetical protein
MGMLIACRHRFTATFLSCLIHTGFESPNQVLNDFIHSMTDFQPLDGDHLCGDEPLINIELEKPHGFDF